MIVLTLKGKAAPDNCGELLQSLTTMLGHVRQFKGCLNCHCYRSVENEYEFCFIEQWSTQENLNTYIHSDLFGAIHGAFRILTDPSEIEMTAVEVMTWNGVLPSGKP